MAQHAGGWLARGTAALTRRLLSGRQFFWSTVLLMAPTAVLILPGDLLREGGRYGWWTPLVAAVPALLWAWAVGCLFGRFGSLTQAARLAGGAVGSRLAAAALWLVLGAYTVVVVREFAQVSAITYVFEDVPIPVLTALGLIPAGLAAWLGLVVVARPSPALAVLLALYGLLLLAMIPFAHFLWALPLLPRNTQFMSWQPLIRTWVWLAEPSLMALAVDEADPAARRAMGRLLPLAVGLVVLLLSITVWMLVADFGPVRAAQLTLPIYEAAREATFGSFLEHMEAAFIPTVILGGAGKIALLLWLWTRAGLRAAAGWGGPGLWLVVAIVGGGTASVALFANAVGLDRSLYSALGRVALPAMVLVIVGTYGGALLRERHRS